MKSISVSVSIKFGPDAMYSSRYQASSFHSHLQDGVRLLGKSLQVGERLPDRGGGTAGLGWGKSGGGTDKEGKGGEELLNPTCLEMYLSDADFERVMGMDKEDFYKLKQWKQRDLKKRVGLF